MHTVVGYTKLHIILLLKKKLQSTAFTKSPLNIISDHFCKKNPRASYFFLLSFTCNYVVSVRRCFLFLLVLEMGCVILLWYSQGLPYNYFTPHIGTSCQIFHYLDFFLSLLNNNTLNKSYRQ